MDEEEKPRKPNIKRDRIVQVGGASLCLLYGPMVHITDAAPVWVTLVNLEPNEYEKSVGEDKAWPRERHMRISHEMSIGTVDELVEDYRIKLTAAFDSLACLDKASGEYQLIPAFGEASFDKQTEVFERHGITSFQCGAQFKVDRETYEVRYHNRRAKLLGAWPRQDAFERDCLTRIVGTYAERRNPGGDDGRPLCGPTESVTRIDELIKALTILKEDAWQANQPQQKAAS